MKAGTCIVSSGLLALSLAAVSLGNAEAACPKLDCGSNSPVMKQFAFHELNETGGYNAEGLRIAGLWSNGTMYRADVVGAELVARNSSGAIVLQGLALEGAYFDLASDAVPAEHFRISIDHVSYGLKLWVDPTAERYYTYRLNWRDAQMVQTEAPAEPLCPMPPSTKYGAWGENYGNMLESVLFAGDRYDARAKTVVANGRGALNWFNVSCAGSTPYKLFMTRHTDITSDSTHQSELDERQAMLKMYVSDVCGTGDALTKQGTPLHWNNLPGWGYTSSADYSSEALWNQRGAMCLTQHRLDQLFASELAQCPLPRCADAYPGFDALAPSTWPQDAHVVSTLPYQP